MSDNAAMLLQTLRQSRILARWVLVWFVLTMGMAVAAPSMQPIALSTVCSTAASSAVDAGSDGLAGAAHHSLQCVLCLGVSAPPQAVPSLPTPLASTDTLTVAAADAVYLTPRRSPLAARAPPRR